jgi:alanine racemase
MRSDLLAQINTDHLIHNYRALKSLCATNVRLCAPLKADAYGHGIRIVAPALQAAGCEDAAVATVVEAVELREVGWKGRILVLGNALGVADPAERRERIEAISRFEMDVTLCDPDTLRIAADSGLTLRWQLKIDTGMGRMGCLPADARRLIEFARRHSTLRMTGVYSHFATADFEKLDLVQNQLATFRKVISELADVLPPQTLRHLANSAATITLPDAHFDMVRPGLALYGYYPAAHMSKIGRGGRSRVELKPILRLVSHLSLVKQLPAGHCVGYGKTFTTTRPTRLGILPVGYFDGFVRALSNAATVSIMEVSRPRLTGGMEFSRPRLMHAPVVGRISMDQLAVDLTDLPHLDIGTEVCLIDDRTESPNSVASLAAMLNTIPYEVTCLLGRRIDRIAVSDADGHLSAGGG